MWEYACGNLGALKNYINDDSNDQKWNICMETESSNTKEKIIQRFISVFLFILAMDEKYINEQYLYM
uniref:Uncharacterized protein n=1 Tax=Anguilla anguilla TaxID=7936 RepID=A0A0E9XDI8_ANGAN